MTVVYRGRFEEGSKKDTLSLTWLSPDGKDERFSIPLEQIQGIGNCIKDVNWSGNLGICREVGSKLFDIMDGDTRVLERALEEANAEGEPLQLQITTDKNTSRLPFELLHRENFLCVGDVDIVRRVSERGRKKDETPQNRPLRVLFMACSAIGHEPELDFEREEEKILNACDRYKLPIDIEVEDTGSLEGLKSRLVSKKYDVVHISGHANIDKDGNPHFWMEDEQGNPEMVYPDDLWKEVLSLNEPRLLFLSGCKTGQAPENTAVASFASTLVERKVSTVLGWGLSVSDVGATKAAEVLYHDLSRGKSIADAVRRTRIVLNSEMLPTWPLLRVFSDGTPLAPIIAEGQKPIPIKRTIQHISLANSQVMVLREGFVGRRRKLQHALRALRSMNDKVGILFNGTGGLGKSCLAGKLCERYPEHTLIVVHGELSPLSFNQALIDGFLRAGDKEAQEIVEASAEIEKKIGALCSGPLQLRQYIILLDDFEKNLDILSDGSIRLKAEAVPIMEALLSYLPHSAKTSHLLITCRNKFQLTVKDRELVSERLEAIGLDSFRGVEERKKVGTLRNIPQYPDLDTRKRLIDAGRGNPRLMEWLDELVGEKKDLDIDNLMEAIDGKEDEFVQEHLAYLLSDSFEPDFKQFLRCASTYRIPVQAGGLEKVCEGINGWEAHREKAVGLSLMEADTSQREQAHFWVTPLIREKRFDELSPDEKKECHANAVSHYQAAVPEAREFMKPILRNELVLHALECGQEDVAVEEGYGLISYLEEILAYEDARNLGEHILSKLSGPLNTAGHSALLNELGTTYHRLADNRRAVKCLEQALEIDREVFGEKHPRVATELNNLGEVWRALGDAKKAVRYYEQALEIDREVSGEKHPNIAIRLNNLGSAWYAQGDAKKAVQYLEQALEIDRNVFGEKHPEVAIDLNNLGEAWRAMGDAKKAVRYFEQALEIDRKVFGEKHPKVATRLNNLGSAWKDLGGAKKAVQYYEQALEIFREVFGGKHPKIATGLNNLGSAWKSLGDKEKAKRYQEEAYQIFLSIYGPEHPSTRTVKGNLDSI